MTTVLIQCVTAAESVVSDVQSVALNVELLSNVVNSPLQRSCITAHRPSLATLTAIAVARESSESCPSLSVCALQGKWLELSTNLVEI